LNNKGLGVLVATDNKKITTGIVTDGQIRRFNLKSIDLKSISVKKIMTKNPVSIDKNALAVKALSLMNNKKITSLCVYNKKNKQKTIGLIHIHHLLQSNIT